MKTKIIILLAICLSFSVKGQDCNYEAYIKELCDLGGTYLKDFRVNSNDNKKTDYRYTLVLSSNTKYLFSCKANGKIHFLLFKDNPQIYEPKTKNKNEIFLTEETLLANYITDNNGKPVFFEYIPEETGAYHLIISSENKSFCAVAMVCFLETVKPNVFVDTSKVYEIVDENASFENGEINNFRNYVSKNFIVDLEKQNLKNFSGKMYVEFTVAANGHIENPEIIKSCGKWELDLQAIMIIKDSPAWKPAKIKGVNVKQKFVIPIQLNF